MTNIWVKYEFHWDQYQSSLEDPSPAGVNVPAYDTTIDGYTVRVFVPYVVVPDNEIQGIPDTPSEFITTWTLPLINGGSSIGATAISPGVEGAYAIYVALSVTVNTVTMVLPTESVPDVLQYEYLDWDHGPINPPTSKSIPYLPYCWILFHNETPLFTDNAETCNFNALEPSAVDAVEQIKANQQWFKLYQAGDGADEVTLPSNSITASSAGFVFGSWFYGQGGDDKITGSPFNDKISGGDDNDTLEGGAGKNDFSGAGSVNLLGETETGENKITSTGGDSYIWYQSKKSAYQIETYKYADLLQGTTPGAVPYLRVSPIFVLDAEDQLFGSKDHIHPIFGGKEYNAADLQAAAAANFAFDMVSDILKKATAAVIVSPGGQVLLPGLVGTQIFWEALRKVTLVGISGEPARDAFIEGGSLLIEVVVNSTIRQVEKLLPTAYKPAYETLVGAVGGISDQLLSSVRVGLENIWDKHISSPTLYIDQSDPNKFTPTFATDVQAKLDAIFSGFETYLQENGIRIKEHTPSPMLPGVVPPTIILHPENQPLNLDLQSLSDLGPLASITGTTFGDLISVGPLNARPSFSAEVTLVSADTAYILWGAGGNDTLGGGGGDDTLIGGLGKDTSTGGLGADIFDFDLKAESGKGAKRDVITDFVHLTDAIDLSNIDANSKKSNDQDFKFIGAQKFHHKAGELHFLKQNRPGTAHDKTIVEGDINGDGKADFQIELSHLIKLTAADFVL